MRYAISLARKAAGNTHPNPLVGSVLVDGNGVIISEGHHEKAGELHAERKALSGIELTKAQKQSSTLYVTLEPCCTHGRTPPCTEIILEKGIRRVVVGTTDPNPVHQSRGIDLLRKAGVEVITGVLSGECRALNPIFNYWIEHQQPLIAVKTATTLDGKIATAFGKSKWITSEAARENVMYWRKYFPAIAVGAGTALADDPSLTIRNGEETVGCATRFILDRSLRTLPEVDKLKVFNDSWHQQTCLVTSSSHDESRFAPYRNKGIRILSLPFEDQLFPIDEFREACKERGIYGVYIEGGLSVVSSFLEVKGIDYLFCYQAPKLFASAEAPGFAGGMEIRTPDEAPFIDKPMHEVFGNDILTHGKLVYP